MCQKSFCNIVFLHFLIFQYSIICHRSRTRSDAGSEQSDFLPHSTNGTSEIIYTVTDVSLVEQGVGGFVKAVKGWFLFLGFFICLNILI